MDIKVLASSSKGNSYYIDGVTPLIIDCGIPLKLIRQKLNFQLSKIEGVLISHQHLDHCRAVPDIIKAGLDCYMSQSTADALDVTGHRVKIVEPLDLFRIGTWLIKSFPLEHDVPNLGYMLENKSGERLVYITDSFYCRYMCRRTTHLMIECNYSLDILNDNVEAGIVPAELKNRLLKSHFSLENVKQFLLANDLSKVMEIHLIHLSDGNSDAERFKLEIMELTGKPVYVGG